MSTSLTLYFVIEGDLQAPGAYLAASIRKYLDPDIQVIGYCSEHKFDDLHPGFIESFKRLNCDIRTFDGIDKFSPAYPHGNKILASIEPRETEFSGFLDTDILFIRDNDLGPFLIENMVSVVPATSMGWADQSIWDAMYAACDMPVPDVRMSMTRKKKPKILPYFNAGVIYFPQQRRDATGRNFAEVWMDTAQRIDAIEDIPRKRPYLDQFALPIAIQRAGMEWNLMPENQNFCLGGRMKHKPLPKGVDVAALHYRYWGFLRFLNHHRTARQALWQGAGAGRMEQVHLMPTRNELAKAG